MKASILKPFFLSSFLLCCFCYLSLTNALSINPPWVEIFSNQLCPDPTTRLKDGLVPPSSSSSSSWPWLTKLNREKPPAGQGSQLWRDVMAINLDKPNDSTHFYESCTFIAEDRKGEGAEGPKVRQSVRVRSINLNVSPWNFTTSSNCSSFIKFNRWDEHDGGRYPVLCGRENFDQFLGPYGHPMVLYYKWHNGALSFPLYQSGYGGHTNRDRKDATLELQYLQIYFIVTSGSSENLTKTCQVQQYRLDWGGGQRSGCQTVVNQDEPVCGTWACSELEALYHNKMTIFKEGEGENDTVLVWQSKSDKYKMRTFLRQKFVPIVFLIVLVCAYRSYMKAGLRYQNSMQDDIPDFRVRSFRHRRRVPSSFSYSGRSSAGPREDFWDYDTDDDDLPPSYNRTGTARTAASSTAVVGTSRAASGIPETAIRIPHGNNIPFMMQAAGVPKLSDSEMDPPPPYESICPPTYKEATMP